MQCSVHKFPSTHLYILLRAIECTSVMYIMIRTPSGKNEVLPSHFGSAREEKSLLKVRVITIDDLPSLLPVHLIVSVLVPFVQVTVHLVLVSIGARFNVALSVKVQRVVVFSLSAARGRGWPLCIPDRCVNVAVQSWSFACTSFPCCLDLRADQTAVVTSGWLDG